MKRNETDQTTPVELVQVSAGDEVVCQGLGVADTLNAGVHEACVAKVTEARGSFLRGDWAGAFNIEMKSNS